MKTCSKCKVEKSEEDFQLRGDTGKRRADCKACCAAQHKIYSNENREALSAKQKVYYAENREKLIAKQKVNYAENREKIAADKKVYYAENRERVLAKNKVYRTENREKTAAQSKVRYAKNREQILARNKAYRTKNREKVAAQKKYYAYGIAPDDVKRLLAEQGGVCAICGGLGIGKKGFCIDHDHETGKVRGLLCSACNQGIGFLKDSSDITRRALEYLKKHGK